MSAGGFEYFEVAADVGIHGWGPDLPECFRQCALGVFNLMVPLEAVEAVESREVAAQGDPPDGLLVTWINECVYLHDMEGFVVRDMSRPSIQGGRIHAILWGEPVDPTRHPRGVLVKAATFHELRVSSDAEGVRARLVLDV